MASAYQLIIRPTAEREIRSLPGTEIERITRRIYSLLENPRPSGCKKLIGQEGYRVRQGDYRILYEVDDSQRTVTVVKVRHRRDVYR
ncbi:MAG: type II toxin-antitoxin system RelE/ParE family toxin [Acidobacteria bacterium]|nr:type II toxin-antitoxin system RelE/ParE family toxin [Acidobacteriota bacterium]